MNKSALEIFQRSSDGRVQMAVHCIPKTRKDHLGCQ